MGMTAEQYLSQLQALLPTGAAWSRDPAATLTLLLAAVAEELARIDGRVDDLIREIDPRQAAELLVDWERLAGFPDLCTGPLETVAERRAAVHARITALGGQSRAYFIALAAALGYSVTITEFRPFVAGGGLAGGELTNGSWPFTWRVNAAETTVRHMTAGSGAGERLASWGNQLLECALGRYAPAHTITQFSYGG